MKRSVFAAGASCAIAASISVPAFAEDAPEEIAVEAAPSAPTVSTPTETPVAAAPPPAVANDDPRNGLVISGYAQAQYEHHQDSDDQLRPGGAPQNLNRFLVRRGRLKAEREWAWSSLMLEIDGNNNSGPELRLQRAEASLLYRGPNPLTLPPMVRLTVGLFDVPVGSEMVESARTRYFTERSLASRALFPSEPDFGLRVAGALGWFRYAFAVVNGEPLGNGNKFGWRDPNAAKDWVVRVAAVAEPAKDAEITFGATFYNGTGFSPGTDATKNGVVWRDLNENGQIDGPAELQGQPGRAATRSESFDRWLLGSDLQVRIKTRLGWLRLFGEAYLASDMDRGLYVANPGGKGLHTRELGYVAGFTQEIGRRLVVGMRTDFYDPNADYLEKQGARLLPARQSIRTWSPMIAFTPDPKARLIFQYDAIRDHFGRNELGLVTDLKNDTWTLRLQVEL